MATKPNLDKPSDNFSPVNDSAPAPAKASETIAAIRILLNGDVQEQKIPARDDKPERTMYKQPCVVIGGPRRLMSEVSVFDREEALAQGCYTFSNDCLQLSKFGRLEISTGARSLRYLRALKPAERDMFVQDETSLDDFAG